MSKERVCRQPGFVDAVTQELGGPRTADLLTRLEASVDWESLAQPVRERFATPGSGGRPMWPVVLMLKAVMLQKWFGLSDPQLEEQLQDRLSFRRFVGLSLEDRTPDETSFVVFRRRLRKANLDRTLFDAALNQIEERGLVVRTGTLVDATILEAPRGKSIKDENGKKTGHTRDSEASFTKKHGRTYHGYKAHIATDRRGVIVRYRYDTAKVHDSQHFDALIADEPKGGAVYADSAYMSADRAEQLKHRGVFCGIIRRRVRGQDDLPTYQTLINQILSKSRAIVEHPFAWIKQMGLRRARYRGERRNELDFALHAMAYNLKRSLSLKSV